MAKNKDDDIHQLIASTQQLIRAIEASPEALAAIHPELIVAAKQAVTSVEVPTPPKRILIEIIGAEFDGRTLDSYASDPTEQYLVYLLMFLTKQGTEGVSFFGAPLSFLEASAAGVADLSVLERPSDGKVNCYTVRERLDEADAILVRIFHSVQEAV